MGDKMRLLPFGELLERIFEEYRDRRSIFDLHESSWYRKSDARTLPILGDQIETVLGPAAGPHTQLSQNIVSSYLTGSRFIELKTVQIMDALEIDKPCIDAYDEGFNTEWSTELSLQKAWEEYARSWIVLHLLDEVFDLRVSGEERSFVLNMSVGYDLKGILTDRMQQYLNRMIDSSGEPLFTGWLDEMEERLPALLRGTGLEHKADAAARIRKRIPGRICKSVTLSTMHGCPPEEVESICRYLLTEKNLDTYVKLNPTLLGYDTVRGILDGLGYDYVTLNPDGFAHDLQWDTAIGILTRLRETAAANGRTFGVKLTNTLASVNDRDELPGGEMYMSGRALFPISINLAAKLSEYFDGDLPISYSGGITIHNVSDVFRTGIRPITMCTVLLKPGGYTRQVQMARALEAIPEWNADRIDVAALRKVADAALTDATLHKSFRGTDEVTSTGALPSYDCYEAPCVSACVINQHIPEYIRLTGEDRYDEALEVIYERNALPSMTGNICDHQCQLACTRLDYEGCLNIREIKKIAVEQGMAGYLERWKKPEVIREGKAVIIGAGPAGLSAAYFLAREGFDVTVREREKDAGGVVRYVVPHFRITREAIESDVEHIRRHGVKFEFGVDEAIDVDALKRAGYTYILMGLGTYQTRKLPIEGDNTRVIPSLDFLTGFNRDAQSMDLGKRVVVIGAGDTAMDCARSALRCPGTTEATIVYRRAFEQMPASEEEYEYAREDGVPFRWLRNPERFDADGTLTLRVMELGEKDASGRRRPEPTDRTETMHVDTVIYAIGDDPDAELLASAGLAVGAKGLVPTAAGGETDRENVYLIGDSRTGASTIVQCIAEGRRAADAITRKEEAEWVRQEKIPRFDSVRQLDQIRARKAAIVEKPDARVYEDFREFAHTEYERCLECNYVCNKCVDVCPNRANITVPVAGEALFSDPFQIVHLDAYCNECGNCGHFCPWEDGVPYIDKPTVFNTREDFDNSANEGWLLEGDTLHVRFGGEVRVVAVKNGLVAPGSVATGSDGGASPVAFQHSADAANAARFFRLFEIIYRDRPHLFGTMEAMV